MSVLSKFDAAVSDAVKKGVITRTRQGPLISAGRKIAKVMDDPGWPIIKGKVDNVSPSVFLKYCEALRLTPGIIQQDQEEDKSSLTILKGSSKFGKRTG